VLSHIAIVRHITANTLQLFNNPEYFCSQHFNKRTQLTIIITQHNTFHLNEKISVTFTTLKL